MLSCQQVQSPGRLYTCGRIWRGFSEVGGFNIWLQCVEESGLNSSEKGTLQGSVGRTAHALTLRDTGEDWRDV